MPVDELLDSTTPTTVRVAAAPFMSRPDDALEVVQGGPGLVVRRPNGGERAWWTLKERPDGLALEWAGPCSDEPGMQETLAALEAAFALHPDTPELVLDAPVSHSPELIGSGIVQLKNGARPRVTQEVFWQQARMWLPTTNTPFPLQYTLTQSRRHPLRPPTPTGVVYQRYVSWLGKTLSFRTVDVEQDLARINRWMNDPVVAEFWQEEGDLHKHRGYLETIAADPHMMSMIASLDGEPFGYFEVYWAKEDRIAPFYDVDDYDRGWHVLVGEAAFRGKQFATAWLPAISHYLFLDDCRTQRIVIEPRADNHKMIRNLATSGYALIKEFDFPHKRAMLGMLLRERFFSERLWVPRDVVRPCRSVSLP